MQPNESTQRLRLARNLQRHRRQPHFSVQVVLEARINATRAFTECRYAAIVSLSVGDIAAIAQSKWNTLTERNLIVLRHLASIGEVVEDVDAAVRFYRDILGLEVEIYNEGYADVTVPGTLHFGIWSRVEAAKATYGSPEAAERVPLGFTIGFEVDEVAAAEKRLADAGNRSSPSRLRPSRGSR